MFVAVILFRKDVLVRFLGFLLLGRRVPSRHLARYHPCLMVTRIVSTSAILRSLMTVPTATTSCFLGVLLGSPDGLLTSEMIFQALLVFPVSFGLLERSLMITSAIVAPANDLQIHAPAAAAPLSEKVDALHDHPISFRSHSKRVAISLSVGPVAPGHIRGAFATTTDCL